MAIGTRVVSKLTVNSRRANNVRLNHIPILSPSFENNFIDITVESRVREGSELFDAGPVVVFFLGPFAQSVGFAVFVSQDASAAGVQPVAWVLLGVAGANAFGDGLRGAFVVGGIGGVCVKVSGRLGGLRGVWMFDVRTEDDVCFCGFFFDEIRVVVAT